MSSKKIIASFIIPTLNAEHLLLPCLESIAQQSFKEYEVLVIDGGSTDGTVALAKKLKQQTGMNLKILKNPNVDAESGKRIGISKSNGKYIVLLDADNRIVGRNWLKIGAELLDKHPKVWGVESEWLVNPQDSLLNQYFSHLKIADPIARVFAPHDSQLNIKKYSNYKLITIKKNMTPVIGANGFFYRKELVKKEITNTKKFEEVNYVAYLVSKGHTTYGRISQGGIYHLYCTSLLKYFSKRKKIALKYLARKEKDQFTWVDKVGATKFYLSALYNASVIGPSIEALHRFLQTGSLAWIFHPIVSFITFAIYAYYYFKKKAISR